MFCICFEFKPCKTMVLYWKTKQPGTYSLQSGFPSFYDCSASDGLCLYGLPSFEYPDMVKVRGIHTVYLFIIPPLRHFTI